MLAKRCFSLGWWTQQKSHARLLDPVACSRRVNLAVSPLLCNRRQTLTALLDKPSALTAECRSWFLVHIQPRKGVLGCWTSLLQGETQEHRLLSLLSSAIFKQWLPRNQCVCLNQTTGRENSMKDCTWEVSRGQTWKEYMWLPLLHTLD